MNLRIALALALAGAATAQAQTCNPHIRRSAPDTRYIVNIAQGTVLDQQTGLTWKRCVEGQSGVDCRIGSPTPLNWGAALSQAAASTFARYKDWRLPNSKELESLVEVACYGPALNATVFPNDPSTGVWASSPYAYCACGAWGVHFYSGYSLNYPPRAGDDGAVRLVRGGQ
jgi:hypothetical protein